MKRPRYQYKNCKECGISRDAAGHLTATGRCMSCAIRLADENNDQLRAHSGPAFDRWRRAMAASVGGILLDDVLGEQ